MIVHTLKICTGNAGPEQSLVLFIQTMHTYKSHQNFFADVFVWEGEGVRGQLIYIVY